VIQVNVANVIPCAEAHGTATRSRTYMVEFRGYCPDEAKVQCQYIVSTQKNTVGGPNCGDGA
jgi:hypothetical protein